MNTSIITSKLSWNSLCSLFSGQWVEIVSSKWKEDEETPKWVQIRCYASSRAELMELIKKESSSYDSIILQVAGATAGIVETGLISKQVSI